MRITALETPGHTPESICLVVADEEKSADSSSVKPWAVLTGDTFFLEMWSSGFVSAIYSRATGGHALRQPAQQNPQTSGRCAGLSAHGPEVCVEGTCGPRKFPPLARSGLRITRCRSRQEEFIEQLTCNLPARPEYFLRDAESIVRERQHCRNCRLCLRSDGRVEDLLAEVESRWMFVPARRSPLVTCPIGEHCVVWTVCLLGGSAVGFGFSSRVDRGIRGRNGGSANEAGTDWTGGCARISKRRSRSVEKAGLPLGELPQISVEDLSQRLQSGRMRVLDVRREREWEDGHIEAASWWPLDNFKVAPLRSIATLRLRALQGRIPQYDRVQPLQRAGFENVVNVVGGFDAWQAAKLPVAAEKRLGPSSLKSLPPLSQRNRVDDSFRATE